MFNDFPIVGLIRIFEHVDEWVARGHVDRLAIVVTAECIDARVAADIGGEDARIAGEDVHGQVGQCAHVLICSGISASAT